ncbi:hypothetical protein K438DRAFT_1614957, partial [Mycena galopus ATCC 62051]
GQEFTLADLFHYSLVPMLAESGIDIMTNQGPNVTRWWNELLSRPSWVKIKSTGIQGTV